MKFALNVNLKSTVYNFAPFFIIRLTGLKFFKSKKRANILQKNLIKIIDAQRNFNF